MRDPGGVATIRIRWSGGGRGGRGVRASLLSRELDSARDLDHHLDRGHVLKSIRPQGLLVIQPFGCEDQADVVHALP